MKLARVKVIVGVVIRKNNKFLLVQEKKPASYGKWNVPAGRVEVGDTIEGRAVKEVREETGCAARLTKKLFIDHPTLDCPVRHIFTGRITGGTLRFPKNEIMNAGWFTYGQIQKMRKQLLHKWTGQAIDLVYKAGK